MKKIKVYLQYPWKVSDSQYYKSIIDNPPKTVSYLNIRKTEGMIVNKRSLLFFNFIKRQVRNLTKKLKLVLVNAHETKINEGVDLIHCAHCLSKNKNIPWVADFESWWQMWLSGGDKKKGKEKVLEILKRKQCKKIIAWTPYEKDKIEKMFPQIKNKLEVVTFAMPLPKERKKRHNNIVLLYVSRYFYKKGGLHTLEVFDRITKKEKNVQAIFVSNTPKDLLEKYSQNNKIKFFGLMPHSEIKKKIFPAADIFVYPGYSDTFGFVFVEALSFGLPVVTVDGFSRKYIIEDEKTGYIVNKEKEIDPDKIGEAEEEIIQRLVGKTVKLIKNKKLINQMSKNCIEEVKNGKFSITKRNKKLEKIYMEVIK